MKRIFLALMLIAGQAAPAQEPTPFAQGVRAYQDKDFETARRLFEAELVENPKNDAARNYLRILGSNQKSTGNLPQILEAVTLPTVDLREASPREAVAFVAQQIEKQTQGKQKLNVVWMVPEGNATPVTLSLQNIPASEALRYIAEAAGLQLQFDQYAVRVKPAAAQ